MSKVFSPVASTSGTSGFDRPIREPGVAFTGPQAFEPTTWDPTAEIFVTGAATPDRARPARRVGRRRRPTLLLDGALDRTVGLFDPREFASLVAARSRGEVRTILCPGIGHVGLVTTIAEPFGWRAEVLDHVVDSIGGRRS